jgi:hypothetical protein
MAPLTDPQAEKLRAIHNIPALVKYLRDELGWPVDADDWEEAVFDWQPDELNLKAEHKVKIRSIKQLRPLVSNQPWGVFFVDFDKGALPITVLRRVLNGLVPKGRVKGGGHQTWHARDLLFISSFGEGTSSQPREIALAHFTDESEVGDLPTLRVLGWDAEDTGLQLGYVASMLKQTLRWPTSTTSKADQDAWRTQWASAFKLQYRQVVNDSKTLALALAELAKRIRSRVNTVLALESEKGHLRQMHKAFKDNLIADLSEDGFADMFAQTITYGLFAARASRGSGALVADDAALMAPNTNPFLKELLQDFLHAGGRAKQGAKRVDFDELGINEVVTTLRDVPMDDVLRSFNAAKPGDDPVIHFYELFLKEYDKKLRAKRGVFYTPRPVVQFIVRSVDEILKTEFGIEDGLASTITWGEMIQRRPELKLPKHCTAQTPFVQILDPATGTATFIVEVIEHVHAHMLGVWRKQGLVTKAQWLPKWNSYVRLHLLPRLFAFELMMAPYAIAHMKIGIKLAETGYTFPPDGPRVNVFLTNALEPAHLVQPQLESMAPMLAHEAIAANRVKEQLAVTVLVGNPPYSEKSSNTNNFIDDLMDRYKQTIRTEEAQIKSVSNDYVKFIRLAEYDIKSSGVGVMGMITANGYMDGRLFRDMRRALLTQFENIKVLDLLGSGRRGDAQELDENVFDILQGVAICICSHFPDPSCSRELSVAKLEGSRDFKFKTLLESTFRTLPQRKLSPASPLFSFSGDVVHVDGAKLWPINEVFGRGFGHEDRNYSFAGGFKTRQDSFTVAFDEAQLRIRIGDLADDSLTETEVRKRYGLCTTAHFDFDEARKAAKTGKLSASIRKIRYRPFDDRPMIWAREVLCEPQSSVTKHFELPNLCLSTSRVVKDSEFRHVAIARGPVEVISLSGSTSTNAYMFPLWMHVTQNAARVSSQGSNSSICNLSPRFIKALLSAFDLKYEDWRPADSSAPLRAEAVLHFIYAVLHSPAYRLRYADSLLTDFPGIPIPGTLNLFNALAELGSELVALHLLERPGTVEISAGRSGGSEAPVWFGADFSLGKVAERGKELADLTPPTRSGPTEVTGKVLVNATSGFANVRLHVWQHTIGGYRVLHKWLDDRRKAGRRLSQDDITHWLRVYAALEATQTLMLKVDAAIDAHGGWSGAFSQNHPPPGATTLAAEQMAQKAQLKAHMKATSAATKSAARTSATGATSLFDFDDDLDALAAAAGAPPRPKARATPAQAAGGKTLPGGSQADKVTDWQAMCAVRTVLARDGALARQDLLRRTARELGFARVGPRIAQTLDDAASRAVRRGIAVNGRGTLTLVARKVEDYERGFLKQHLLACVAGRWWSKMDVPVRFARSLGFARTGSKIEATVWNLMQALLRSGDVQRRGRGDSAEYRKAKVKGD